MDKVQRSVDDVYSSLLRKAHGGSSLNSMTAPPLSAQFVKSQETVRASAGVEGAFAEIIFPSRNDIDKRIKHKFGDQRLFDYDTTRAAAAYPIGYGERSAQAIERETAVYQLRGVFPQAVQKLALLRARVEARGGSIECVNRIFAAMWGLTVSDVELLPTRHLNGSEATRMAAMEDRAYHALSGHPAHVGGFRVDMATITPDQLGDDVPLNWPRLRTGLKMVASLQAAADLEMQIGRQHLPNHTDLRWRMDIAANVQPRYVRSDPWELIVDRLLGSPPDRSPTTISMEMTLREHQAHINLHEIQPDEDLQLCMRSIANVVSEMSTKALQETITAIQMYDHDRALIEDQHAVEHDELSQSVLGKSFQIPKQVVTRDTLKYGMKKEYFGEDHLPDIVSHGKGHMKLDPKELRAAGLMSELTVGGALHLAVYITVNQRSSTRPCAKLLRLVRDPNPGAPGPVTSRLRNEKLYEVQAVRELGPALFGEAFKSCFESIVANMLSRSHYTDKSLTQELWEYVSSRCKKKRRCPSLSSWRDLVPHLHTAPEGWSLYYWARAAIGKLHHSMSNAIFAPIAAGEEIDLLEMMKRGARARAQKWAVHYGDKTEEISEKIADCRRQIRDVSERDWTNATTKYIAPQHRDRLYFEMHYDKEAILERISGYTQEEYQDMVEYQVKSKVFHSIDITTRGRELAVGLSDTKFRDLLIEFYQSRWLSLEVRIKRAIEKGEVFHLGKWALPVHPWGDLAKEFPHTAQEMMDFSMSLDDRAWTVDPDYLWSKVKKSIGELWGDITRELDCIVAYIDEKVDCAPDVEVDNVMATRVHAEISDMLPSYSLSQTLVLPAPGYRAPYRLPEKTVSTPSGSQLYAAGTYIATTEQTTTLDDLDGFGDDDDLIEIPMRTNTQYESTHGRELVQERYLTYYEIWEQLELPDVDDRTKMRVLALRASLSLDDEHLDSTIGPLVLRSEVERTRRMWAGRMSFILKRLNGSIVDVPEDDM